MGGLGWSVVLLAWIGGAALAWGVAALRTGRHERRVQQSIVDALGEGVAVADATGRLVMFNPAAESILGLGLTESGPESWSEVYGLFRPDGETPIPAEDLPLARAIAGEASRDVEIFVRNPALKQGVFIRVTATPLRDAAGKLRGGVAVFRDTTERRRTEARVRESERRFRSIVEATACGLVIVGADRRIVELNPEAERVFGGERRGLRGADFVETCFPVEFRAVASRDLAEVGDSGEPRDLECPVPHREGVPERILLWAFSRGHGPDGDVGGWIATAHDVTERKEAEQSRRMRELAHHLQVARENERRHIAREIHDELGQSLTGLKYGLSHLEHGIGAEAPESGEQFGILQRLIDSAIGSVRRIAGELRPQILDELGLAEALRWQGEEFRRRTGVPCEVRLPDRGVRLDSDRAMAVFRIVQESLTNVARHAAATAVSIDVIDHGRQYEVRVADDGKGMDPAAAASERSFGLLGMEERARMFGGTLELESAPARGTTVRLVLPRG